MPQSREKGDYERLSAPARRGPKRGPEERTVTKSASVGGQERLRPQFGTTPDSVFCSDPPHPRAARVPLLLLFAAAAASSSSASSATAVVAAEERARVRGAGGTRIAGIFVWGYNAHVTYGTLSASRSVSLCLSVARAQLAR